MKLATTIALCLSVCSVAVALAASDTYKTAPFDAGPLNTKPPSELQRHFEQTVELCIRAVRAELPYSQFDAYVEEKVVNMIGTEDSRFKFYKCMSKNGLHLSPSKESER